MCEMEQRTIGKLGERKLVIHKKPNCMCSPKYRINKCCTSNGIGSLGIMPGHRGITEIFFIQ